MKEQNKDLEKCRKLMMDYLKDMNSEKTLDIIIDTYDQIRNLEMDRDSLEQKFLKTLYSLKQSKGLSSVLDEKDMKCLSLFLGDFLEVETDGKEFYIGNRDFANLSLYNLYNLLIETKYLKEKGISNNKWLSI